VRAGNARARAFIIGSAITGTAVTATGALAVTSPSAPATRTATASGDSRGASAAGPAAATAGPGTADAGPGIAGGPGTPGAAAWARGSAERSRATVVRDGKAATIRFTVPRAGEAAADFTVAAPGVSWDRAGSESAVVSAAVDGAYVSDIVAASADRTPRRLALGTLSAGRHTLTLDFAEDRSPEGARSATLARLRFGAGGAAAQRYAPVLLARTLPETGGPFQNARTDTPQVAWHDVLPAPTPGHRVLQYNVVWSNEDGGTGEFPPALMAVWGRTSDIEWIYRVEVDERGVAVPGTAVYQGPGHQTLPFDGRYEGGHPVLQTCTTNNMVCANPADAPMRFALDYRPTIPATRAREVIMDRNPWTYGMAAREMVREGRVESPSNADTLELGDPRAYLQVQLAKTTQAPGTGAPGVAIGVRLRAAPDRVYRSDHGLTGISVFRDGPAATTVELPAGTTARDVLSVEAIRAPDPNNPDNGSPVTVTALHRGFLLDRAYLPGRSFVRWTGTATLTQAQPAAVLWRR
jgi:hypothetical protein